MKFTSKELAQIEQTVGKLAQTVSALCDYESTEQANMRYLTYIIAELRQSAIMINSTDRTERLAGFDRAANLITAK